MQFCMATSDRQENWQAGDDDDQAGFRHKLTSRQDTSRRLPQSEDVRETTVTVLDSHPATSSRPPSGASRPSDQLTSLPVVGPTTSSDDLWSAVPPVSDKDRSSVKSDDSRPASAASIPARLPALNVRQSSKEDLKTDVETDKPKATDALGSVESIKMEVGAQSGRLPSAGEAGAWTKEKPDDIAVDDTTETTLGTVPADAAEDNVDEQLRQPEPQDDMTASKHDDVPTSTNDPQHDEIMTSSEVAKTDPDDTIVSHTRGDDGAVPENVQTFEDPSPFDDQSRNEAEVQPENTEVQTPEQTNTPGENDSGVNVEDVRNDEPITAEQEQNNDAIQQPEPSSAPETQPAHTTSSNRNLLQVTPPAGDAASLSPRRQHGDGDRLSTPRKSLIPGESGRRRNSFLDVRDSKQLRASDENLHNADQNKPRLLALAQKGEWSVLDQLLRAMERSSFHEVNLADEV